MRFRLPSWVVERWLLWLAIIAFLALVISQRVRIRELERLLLEGQWQWIGGAIGLQILYYLLYAVLYQSAFATVGVESRVLELVPVLFAAVFLRVLAPVGGFGPAALFIDDAVRRGQSGARATNGILLEVIAENTAVVPVLAIGLSYLLLRDALLPYEAIGTAIFLVYVLALIGILLLGRWRPDRVRALLGWLRDRVNAIARIFGRAGLLPPDWAARNAAEFYQAARAIISRPRLLARVLAVATGLQALNLATLYFIFRAFNYPVGLGTLAAGLGIGLVFAIIYILPYDIGVLQGVMVIVFISLGVPSATAIIVAVVFGGLNAWLPLLLGFFFLRRVRFFGGRRR